MNILTKSIILSIFLAAVAFGAFGYINNINTAEAWGSTCGSCDTDTGSDTSSDDDDSGDYKTPARCVSFTASTSRVPYGGGNVTLSWSIENASSASISGVGAISVRSSSGSQTVFVSSNTTFTLTVDGSSSNSCAVSVTVDTPPATPASCVSFSADRTTVPYGGGTVNLSWNTQNATSVNISGVANGLSASGSRAVNVTGNTTFTLTAVGAGGNDSHCTVSITVAPAEAAKCISFTSNKTTVPYGGGDVVLTWTTENASSVNISGVANGLSANGSRSVSVTGNTTFTLTAVGTGGNDSHCTVSITVAPASAPVCVSFTANKSVVKDSGENVTLSWNTQNATSVSINNGIGNVTPVSSGSYTVFVDRNITYTLTVNGAGGQTTCTVSITKETTQTYSPRCEYLRASDTRVEEGDTITLSWSTTHADDVTISPQLGSVSKNGDARVTINDDTTFTLRAKGDNGQEDTCTVTVNVDEEEDDEPKPKCELEVSKKRVNKGDKVTLSWDTSRAEDIRIRDDRGNTIFDTDDYRSSDRRKYFDGEIDVIINRDTEFTLTARGDGGSKTCKVEVETEDDLAVYENRDQGYVIALTQVPYTGFEAGPFLTFLFYAVLTLWALFIAYVLVIKKSSVLGFSLYGNNGASAASEADIANRKKVEALVAKYSGLNQK